MKTKLLILTSILTITLTASAGDTKETKIVRIGAVATPAKLTVFQNLKTHLNRSGYPSDYVLYSTYDALVDDQTLLAYT